MAKIDSDDPKLYIHSDHMNIMIIHVKRESSIEGCGLIAGTSNTSLEIFLYLMYCKVLIGIK